MAQGGQKEPLRIMMIGKTGKGKSALGNSMIGKDTFLSKSGMKSTTHKSERKKGKMLGVDVEIIDTPGLTDTHRDEKEIIHEISKCLGAASPEPHAVLMVCSARDRFTAEEFDVYKRAKKLIGSSLVEHMLIVFTGMDRLQADKVELPEEIKHGTPELKQMLEDAHNRYCGINNLTQDQNEMKRQVTELLTKIQDVAAARNHATDPLLEEVNEEVQRAVSATMRTENKKTRQEAEDEVKDRIMAGEQAVTKPIEKRVKSAADKKGVSCKFL